MSEDVTTLEINEDETPDHFAVTPKDLSHVTLYFDLTPGDREDEAFYFVKIETPDFVDDDFDHWYQAALEAVIAKDPALEDARFLGAALKYGSGKSGGGEVYYALDRDNADVDSSPTGDLVQGRQFGRYEGGVEYNYSDLF